jgi:predicted  nucleic acid-binding Zn ribbon protein
MKLNLSSDGKAAGKQSNKEGDMNGDQAAKQILGTWRASWETYLKTVRAAEEQGDRMLDLMLKQSDALHDEGRKLVKQWVENAKEASRTYLSAVEQNVKKIDDILEVKVGKE